MSTMGDVWLTWWISWGFEYKAEGWTRGGLMDKREREDPEDSGYPAVFILKCKLHPDDSFSFTLMIFS